MNRIIKNSARCKKCHDVLVSVSVHDFKWCTCRTIFVDGGREYLRRGGDFSSLEDLSEFEGLEESEVKSHVES